MRVKSRKDKQGIGIIIGVVVLFLILSVLTYRLKAAANDYDQETLCRNDSEYPLLKLMIDKTDPWSVQDRGRLATLIRRIKDGLAEGERLSIYILDETGTYSSSPVFDMCNPGRGAQANALYENPRLVQERFEASFVAPLEGMLDELLRPGTAPQSPLLETFAGLKSSSARKERLVVVSDMLQNSDSISFYRVDERALSAAGTDAICPEIPHYLNAAVHVINRPAISIALRQQTRNFWDRCLGNIADAHSWEAL
jgi:hypothetical protein